MRTFKTTLVLRAAVVGLALAPRAWPQMASGQEMPATQQTPNPAAALASANELLGNGKYSEAVAEFQRLTDAWDKVPELRRAADRARFNQACALAGMEQPESAAGILRRLIQETEDTELRGAARHNLGLAEAKLADQAAQSDPAKAIELLRRAERSFRNAAADQQRASGRADDDTTKNIEVAQRKSATLEAEQKKKQEQQQKEQQNQEEKQEKEKQPQDKQRDTGQQQSDGTPQQKDPSGKQQQDQKDAQGGSDPKLADEQNGKPSEQNEPVGPGKPSDGANPQKEALSEDQQQDLRNEQQSYDLTAMQILEKERQNRALIRQLIRRMRGKLAPVEKDW